MHEMSIMQSVLDAAFEALKQSGETRITEISLTIGEQTDIQEIPLNFAFDALKQNTPARNARLRVKMFSTRSHCNDCAADFDHDRFSMLCPICGSVDIALLTGRELRIDGMEADSQPFEGADENVDIFADIIEEARAEAAHTLKDS
ncbi:MAG: hydrogenase maturation nickel metallochaperone HypA [Coriobacteriia bacterium]|nr:hydrogenase maturation nickel metallochaperone HypA [Coriobacteriia bacterium]MCL2746385.1 hydrogenase maturation nickel metallochaperone HypA [Coriobacteriia bacterium]MCL2870159.1 hydrogenase maturation nickel metallochaperone HypA [Coriobacteriia bacterium]